MQSASYSQCAYSATSEILELYNHFFLIFDYFSSVNDGVLGFHEKILKASVLRNYAELEREYQLNLRICFGECPNIMPLLAIKRPKLKHQITLRNAWDFTFDAFGSVDVFMAGHSVRVGHTERYNLSDFLRAKQRVLRSIRELYIGCCSFMENYHIANGNTPEYAYEVVRRVDSQKVLD